MKYLHILTQKDGLKVAHLDHRLRPEVRAMLCAMASRMPAGGIEQRYRELVDTLAGEMWDRAAERRERVPWAKAVTLPGETDLWNQSGVVDDIALAGAVQMTRASAEDVLTSEITPTVKRFMDTFVGQYGHASIMELTGDPAIFIEGVSWYTAWLSFDSPLVRGQEFSTRAKSVANWPMCFESGPTGTVHFEDLLVPLHRDWLEVFEAEVAWWTEHLAVAENREALGIADKEPFRPAFDRARWALPGTIATGFAHTGNLRDMSRVVDIAQNLLTNAANDGAPNGSSMSVWISIAKAYAAALPGLEGYGLRAAVPNSKVRPVPGHLMYWNNNSWIPTLLGELVDAQGNSTDATVAYRFDDIGEDDLYVRGENGGYLDPGYNRVRSGVIIRCSLAVARDWHRHRTLYPWTMRVLTQKERPLALHHVYEPKSDFARARVPKLLERSQAAYLELLGAGNHALAILALPLGSECLLYAQGGLRDITYMAELRANAHGANFEYEAQAEQMLAAINAETPLKDY